MTTPGELSTVRIVLDDETNGADTYFTFRFDSDISLGNND